MHNQEVEYFSRNPLKHILHLKMLAYHGSRIRANFIKNGDSAGALLQFPTTALAYDKQIYKDYDLVAMPAADSPQIFEQLLKFTPKKRVIFKLINKTDQKSVISRFGGAYVRSFENYTTSLTTPFHPTPSVKISVDLTDGLSAAFVKNNYSASEITGYLREGGKIFSIYNGDIPVSVGIIFPILFNIWEIAGLYTEPSMRRMGHANKILRAAINEIQEMGGRPRYVVEETNLPSIKLAQTADMTHFLTVIHHKI